MSSGSGRSRKSNSNKDENNDLAVFSPAPNEAFEAESKTSSEIENMFDTAPRRNTRPMLRGEETLIDPYNELSGSEDGDLEVASQQDSIEQREISRSLGRILKEPEPSVTSSKDKSRKHKSSLRKPVAAHKISEDAEEQPKLYQKILPADGDGAPSAPASERIESPPKKPVFEELDPKAVANVDDFKVTKGQPGPETLKIQRECLVPDAFSGNEQKAGKEDLFKAACVDNKHRSRFRAVSFLPGGKLKFYETTRRTDEQGDALHKVTFPEDDDVLSEGETPPSAPRLPYHVDEYATSDTWKNILQSIREEDELAQDIEIPKRTALRNWILNNPFKYKVHRRVRQAIREEEERLENMVDDPVDTLKVPQVTPYDFIDVSQRVRLDYVSENVIAEDDDPVENQDMKRGALEVVTASTVSTKNNVGQPNQTQNSIKKSSRSPHGYPRRWASSDKVDEYEWLDRCFVYRTDGDYTSKLVNLTHLDNEETLSISTLDESAGVNARDCIYDNTVIWAIYDEHYECEERQTGPFFEALYELKQTYELSGLVSALHEQFSFRERCEETNHWRKEIFTSHGGLTERSYITHSLASEWNMSSCEIFPDGVEDSEGTMKKDPFSSDLMSVDDMFGTGSPLYFPGNVTYVLLYNKEDSYNERYTHNVDVLSIVTKLEFVAPVNANDHAHSRLKRAEMKRRRQLDEYRIFKLQHKDLDELDPETRKEIIEAREAESEENFEKRRLRPNWDENSYGSSSDSDDSIISNSDAELENYHEDLVRYDNDDKLSEDDDAELKEWMTSMKTSKSKVALRGGGLGQGDATDLDQAEMMADEGNSDEFLHQEPLSEDNLPAPVIRKRNTKKPKKKRASVDDITLQNQSTLGEDLPPTFGGALMQTISKHKTSMFLIVLAFICVALVQVLAVLEESEKELTIEEEVRYQQLEYTVLGLTLFCVVLAFCLFVIRFFKDAQTVDTRTNYKDVVLEGKNFVISNFNLEQEVNDIVSPTGYNEAITTRKNHRVVVLYCNIVPSPGSINAIDTAHTVETSLGNITRIADCTLQVDFSLNGTIPKRNLEALQIHRQPKIDVRRAFNTIPESELFGDPNLWRNVSIYQVRDITGKNFNVAELPHLAENPTYQQRTRIKSDIVFEEEHAKPKNLTTNRWLSPDLRNLFAVFSIVWSVVCICMIVLTDDALGFYLLPVLVLPAFLGTWDNPFAVILGLFFAMHYGASGGVVGKMLCSGYKRTVDPSTKTYLYSLAITVVPLVFTILEFLNYNKETTDQSGTFLEKELFVPGRSIAIAVGALTVASNLPVAATFTRRFYLEALEVISPPSMFIKRMLSFYYAIEAISLNIETCVFILNLAQPDDRILLSEISDIARRFTSGEKESRKKRNGFGVPTGISCRSQDSVWGLIDDQTRENVILSPVDPGFKSIYFQASGATVFGAAYYAANFYRCSVAGLRDKSVSRLVDLGASTFPFYSYFAETKTGEVPEKENRLERQKYNPSGTNGLRVICWHFSYIICILLETLLYMPSFALYIGGYLLASVIGGALLFPIGIIFTIAEKIYSRNNPEVIANGPPRNFIVQIFAVIAMLILTIQLSILLLVKTIVVMYNLTIKSLLSKFGKRVECQFFLTPKMSLFFLPPMVPTDRFSAEKDSAAGIVKRKRLFKHSDGGYWNGELNVFADIPLFPKTHPINVVLCDDSTGTVVRGKVRSNRDITVGVAGPDQVNQVGMSR